MRDAPAYAPKSDRSVAIAAAKEAFAAGRFGDALAVLDDALAAHPGDAELLFERASHLLAWGRNHEARVAFLRASEAGFENVKLCIRLAWCSLWSAHADDAVHWMRQAVARDPDDWEAHYGLGTCLQALQRADEAVESFERALSLSPDNPHCLASIFNLKLGQKKTVEALATARRAVEVHPRSATAWTNLAIGLISDDQFTEAMDAFRAAEALERSTGAEIDEHLNAALCFRDIGRASEAVEMFERKLPGRTHPGPHAHYGVALLTSGRLREGWAPYEFRWMQEPMRSLRLPLRKPRWIGQDLLGKTILLRCEQGVGDVIQFVRYAPYVKALGAKVLLQLRKGIDELAECFDGIDEIVYPDSPCPDFDFYVPLMSLPGVFGTDLESIPADVPYVAIGGELCETWRRRLGETSKLKVGLVWAGDAAHLRDRYRSVPLSALAPLAKCEGVAFYSLQKGKPAEQCATPPAAMHLVDLAGELTDYRQTAAAITALDLVVCVDTSVAHLAGALGKPVWVLLPTPADWRWMETREDNPWYPTMRLFRQRTQGAWAEVIERVAGALAVAVSNPAGILETNSEPIRGRRRSAPVSVETLPNLPQGICAVAETRFGILEYSREQPIVAQSIHVYGEYLQQQLDLLARLVKPGAVVVEAGAGIGTHALFLSEAVGPGGHVYLYEPRTILQQILQQNLAANGITNVTVMRRRLGSRDAVDVGRGNASQAVSDPFACVETIDELRLPRLDWLKISEPGEAHDILEGAAETLWRLRPLIFSAVRDEDETLAVSGRLRDFGYRSWRMDAALFNADNFNRFDRDIFGNAAAIALVGIPEEIEVDITLHRCQELRKA